MTWVCIWGFYRFNSRWIRIAELTIARTGSPSERSVAYLFVPASDGGSVGAGTGARACHFASGDVRCWDRYLFISNMVTFFLPNTASRLSSARISRRFSGFCKSCFRM
jgi:hypothetical protein